jgi:hypothetical protein
VQSFAWPLHLDYVRAETRKPQGSRHFLNSFCAAKVKQDPQKQLKNWRPNEYKTRLDFGLKPLVLARCLRNLSRHRADKRVSPRQNGGHENEHRKI